MFNVEYVSMLFRIIGEVIKMKDFSDELFKIHDSFQIISSELETPLTTTEEFFKKIERLLEKIE